MISQFTKVNGSKASFDLDEVVEIIRTHSREKHGWTCIVVFDPLSKSFIEIRSSPPDYRGNSEDEAVEILFETLNLYGLSREVVENIKQQPARWVLIDERAN